MLIAPTLRQALRYAMLRCRCRRDAFRRCRADFRGVTLLLAYAALLFDDYADTLIDAEY